MLRLFYFIALLYVLSIGSLLMINQLFYLINIDILLFIKSIDLNSIYIISIFFIWGLLGGLINSLTAKWQIKKLYQLKKIESGSVLFNKIIKINDSISKKLKISPAELFYYTSDEKNAFTTGYSKKSAIIALSSNLIYTLNDNEIEAILYHEYAHIVNGDMITQQILEGILQSYIIFNSKLIQISLIKSAYFSSIIPIIIIGNILEWFFLFLAKLFCLWFSRHRELTADKFVVKKQGSIFNIINALNSLSNQEETTHSDLVLGKKIFNIYEYKNNLLSTHPSFKNRLINIEKSL